MSILAIFQLMTISPGFFPEGGNLFAACKSFAFNWMRFSSFKIRISFPTLGKLFNWAHFGSSIRSSDTIKPLNIHSYWYDWTGRYTRGAVRPEKGWFCVFWSGGISNVKSKGAGLINTL